MDQMAAAQDVSITHRFARSSSRPHITLITAEECRQLVSRGLDIDCIKQQLQQLQSRPCDAGLAKNEGVLFKVILWPEANEARARLFGLAYKELHITLSQHNKHDISKGLSQLIVHAYDGSFSDARVVDILHAIKASILQHRSRPALLSEIRAYLLMVLDAVENSNVKVLALQQIVYCSIYLRDFVFAEPHAVALVSLDAKCAKSWICAGDAFYKSADGSVKYYAAAFCYWSAIALLQQKPTGELHQHCIKMLASLQSKIDVHPQIVTKDAIESAYAQFIPKLAENYSRPLWEVASGYFEGSGGTSMLDAAAVNQRRFAVTSGLAGDAFYRLPRYFSFVVPMFLAGMSTPRCKTDIEALGALGVRLVITLTAEQPLPKEWFAGRIKNTFHPVRNYEAPTQVQIDAILESLAKLHRLNSMEQHMNSAVVHCGGGKGRAGTVLACYLVRYGFGLPKECDEPAMSSSDAIALLRALRPGSIETAQQEAFVHQYAGVLWKRANMAARAGPFEDAPLSIRCVGSEHCVPQLVICSGLPASGKSTFASMLAAHIEDAVVISQDEHGSRTAAEQALMRVFAEAKRPVILDRCNPTIAERAEWYAIAGNPQNTIAVHFETDESTCLERISHRINHPTLRGKSQRHSREAIEQFKCKMQPPTAAEAYLQAVWYVRTASDVRELVCKLSYPLFFKYPRTKHLYASGATRDDLVLSSDDAEAFLRACSSPEHRITVEEKIDGANIGFRLELGAVRAQNRSHHVNSSTHDQFRRLDAWANRHDAALRAILRAQNRNLILFGEWLAAKHTVAYDSLPDAFVAFDLYDLQAQAFLSRTAFRSIMQQHPEIHCIRQIECTEFSQKSIADLKSNYSTCSTAEGIVIRIDHGEWLKQRAKMVRANFIQGARWNHAC